MTTSPDDAATDLLIREVDDDLRQENLEKLWKKYGALFIGVAVAAVLAVAGGQAWRTWKHDQALQSSLRFGDAMQMLDKNDKVKANQSLEKLALDGTVGYRLLANMKLAQMKANAGDLAAAIGVYDQVAVDSGVDPSYRTMARLKAAYLRLQSGDVARLEAEMTPLAAETSPWRHSAREVLALLELKAGHQEQAKEWLRKVADDIAAPAGIRGRTTELLAALESASKE